jgi:hypothetical protein
MFSPALAELRNSLHREGNKVTFHIAWQIILWKLQGRKEVQTETAWSKAQKCVDKKKRKIFRNGGGRKYVWE